MGSQLTNKSRLIGYGFMGLSGEYLKKIAVEISGKSGTKLDFKFSPKPSDKTICYDTLEEIREVVRFLSTCRITTELIVVELHQSGKDVVSRVWD